MLGVNDTYYNDCLEADSRKDLPMKMSLSLYLLCTSVLYLMADHIQAAEAGPVFTLGCLQQDLQV